MQGLAAVLGGTQCLHTNSYDEAIALPTAKAARLALRTQQVLAFETDVTKTVDPFAGSYVVESLTDALEAEIVGLIAAVDEHGGAVAAIEQGFQKDEIERSAYQVAQEIDDGERVVVGVNRFTIDEKEPYEPLRVDPAIEVEQREALERLRARRDGGRRREGARRAEGRRRGHRQRAAPDAGRARRRGHGRRGLQRAARRLGHLRAPRPLLTCRRSLSPTPQRGKGRG